jgi:hypothetical protein
VPAAEKKIKLLVEKRKKLSSNLRKAYKKHKKYYNAKHKLTRFCVKEKVMLASKNIRQLKPSRKLANKYLGLFEVVEIIRNHEQAYKLKLLLFYKIYNVFHVFLLEL